MIVPVSVPQEPRLWRCVFSLTGLSILPICSYARAPHAGVRLAESHDQVEGSQEVEDGLTSAVWRL